MTFRIQWQRDGKGGFIAYPEGGAFPHRCCQIEKRPNDASWPWAWRARCDEARTSGTAKTQQEAADAAREAWPGLAERAAVLAGIAAEEEALRTLVKRMMSKGDLPLSIFEIETATSEKLTRIIWIVREAGGLGGLAQPLVAACSEELFRRRTT